MSYKRSRQTGQDVITRPRMFKRRDILGVGLVGLGVAGCNKMARGFKFFGRGLRVTLPSASKAQEASRAAWQAIRSAKHMSLGTSRVLAKLWQENEDRINTALQKLENPDLSEWEIRQLDWELDSLCKEQQKIQALAAQYG